MKGQEWKLKKLKAIETYFEKYERGETRQIQGYIINNVRTAAGLPVRNAAMSSAEIGQLLKQFHFIKNEDGSWSMPGKRPSTTASAGADC